MNREAGEFCAETDGAKCGKYEILRGNGQIC
jgi:hypothetical protein